MSSVTRSDDEIGNRLLKALPRDEYGRLAPHLERVHAELKQTLYAYEEPIPDVYFLHEGVVSLIQFLDGEEPVEVATVGNEGMVGLPVFHGADRTPARAFVQIPGDALRMEREVFRRLVTPGTPLHQLLHRYTHALLVQLAQNSACNRRHSLDMTSLRRSRRARSVSMPAQSFTQTSSGRRVRDERAHDRSRSAAHSLLSHADRSRRSRHRGLRSSEKVLIVCCPAVLGVLQQVRSIDINARAPHMYGGRG